MPEKEVIIDGRVLDQDDGCDDGLPDIDGFIKGWLVGAELTGCEEEGKKREC